MLFGGFSQSCVENLSQPDSESLTGALYLKEPGQILIANRLCYGILPVQLSERSSAWLEHLVWDQDVAGSNPVAPTISFSARGTL